MLRLQLGELVRVECHERILPGTEQAVGGSRRLLRWRPGAGNNDVVNNIVSRFMTVLCKRSVRKTAAREPSAWATGASAGRLIPTCLRRARPWRTAPGGDSRGAGGS